MLVLILEMYGPHKAKCYKMFQQLLLHAFQNSDCQLSFGTEKCKFENAVS